MAVIKTSGALDYTTVNSDLTITVKSRSASSVTFSYSINTYLNSSGYTGAGYETYTGTIVISGTNITSKTTTVTLKEKSVEWSGNTVHTLSGTITVSTSSYANLTATVGYTVKSSADSSNSNTGSTTLTTGSGAVIPTAPTISIKALPSGSTGYFYIGYNADTSVVITATGGTNISSYKWQYSIGAGWVDIATTTTNSYTATKLPTIGNGNTISFRAVVSSTTGNTADATHVWLYGAYYKPSAPTDVMFSSEYYEPDAEITLSWTAPPETVMGYKVQYKIDSGSWVSLDDVTETSVSYSDISLSVRQSIQFRVAAYNDTATGNYTLSPRLIYPGGVSLCIVRVNINGTWKICASHGKKLGTWHNGVMWVT